MIESAPTRLRPRALAILAFVGVLVAALLVAVPGGRADAANAGDFRDGAIISDSIFFDGGAMTASQVQTFLNGKISSCRSGYTCLRDFRQDTWTRAADPMCSAYQGAANESAATIIAKVGKACGINPQVILVLLQKEQTLVTDTWPTDRQYRSATGYGCPDTAPCDSEYYGFFNQVYKGAWALKRYTQPAGTGPGTEWNSRFDLSYPVGRTSNVYYNPNAGCGTKPVAIQNQATHSLYLYTPYTPNQAALNAGYGLGDGCSAYGNRNFFLFFTDWFGSTGYSVAATFASAWVDAGGLSGRYGEPTTVERFDSGGRWQAFRGGVLTQRDGASVIGVDGEMGARYLALGAGLAGIGLPTGGVEQLNGGTHQLFQRGTLYWTTSASAIEVDGGETGAAYKRAGAHSGYLGFPTTFNRCGLKDGGCYQDFQGGSIHYSGTTGAHPTSGAIRTYWQSTGWEDGILGYPTGDPVVSGGTMSQTFQGGRVTVSPSGTASYAPNTTAIGEAYARAGGPSGYLGAPRSAEQCWLKDGGCFQEFQNGSIHWTAATGAHPTSGAMRTYWESLGWENGRLGFPTGDPVVSDKGTVQEFQGQTVYARADGAIYMVDRGQTGAEYARLGGQTGVLGWPIVKQRCSLVGGGCYQAFETGSIHWSPSTSARGTWGAVRDYWEASGWENGPLGYPSGDAQVSAAGVVQQFQKQTVYVFGSSPVQTVDRGETGAAYIRSGSQGGTLGWPVSAQRCGLANGGCYQDFQGGSIHWSPATSGRATSGAIRDYWGQSGWENGPLGYPSSDAVTSNGVTVQQFQGGQVRLSGGQVTFTRN